MEDSPLIIQGGMGAAVSSWRLARAVSSLGQLGVVSGVALDVILSRRLQEGDLGGDIRRALASFPVREMADRILAKYFVSGGKSPDEQYKPIPMHSAKPNHPLHELTILGNFVEVFLAREGHGKPVGINYLEKIQLLHLPSIYGAMLAGVAFVIVGAGIATRIPGVLDLFAQHLPASYELQVAGGDTVKLEFEPRTFVENHPDLERPKFLSIISSNVLATTMLKRSNGKVDGFIVERSDAGGHNAPPRGTMQLDDEGQPVYGVKDHVDLEKLRKSEIPFWLAGGQATRENLEAALAAGAEGIQVGTAFALCEESGLSRPIRQALINKAKSGTASVFTDPLASPTGFPFKVANLDGSLAEPGVYDIRPRICDLGMLRQAYRRDDGELGYRCPAEPIEAYVAKGGDIEDTAGRKCLCNGLVANVGLGQARDGWIEPPLVTAGDDLARIARFVPEGQSDYSAEDVIRQLLPV